MAGILDKKVKFIDLVVTQEGRRQMANGDLKVTFASLTDKHGFYDEKESTIKASSDRIYFETPSFSPEDIIILETDDSGRLVDTTTSEDYSIVGDHLFASNPQETSLKQYIKATSGSLFASTSKKVYNKTIENFKKNKFIKTRSGFDFDE